MSLVGLVIPVPIPTAINVTLLYAPVVSGVIIQ